MSMTKINWYPGHMKKTKEMIVENMKIIDIVLDVVDARVPISSSNPDIEIFTGKKKRIILLNKSDLVEKEELEQWKNYFRKNSSADNVLEISAENGYNIKALFKMIEKISREKVEKMKKKGVIKVSIRLMIAGIPNVGKSQLINKMVGKKVTGVGNKPGFTRGKQWIRIKDGLELLDTPGILWPKFEDEIIGYNLAMAGAIKDEILPIEEVATRFIQKIIVYGKIDLFMKKYKLTVDDMNEIPEIILKKIATNMKMIFSGDRVNIKQAALTVLRDYRAKKLGKFGLEK